MYKNHFIITIFAAFLAVFSLQAQQLDYKELLTELAQDEHETIEAIALYPKDIRADIFEASMYPEALIKLENIKNRTSNNFTSLVENLSQDDQLMIYDLTRYPGLIEAITVSDKRSIEQQIADYPTIIHQRALRAHRKFPQLISMIYDLEVTAENASAEVIAAYPLKVQSALVRLIELPEVLTVLNEHIKLTILVGDAYRADPEWIIHKADSINLVVVQNNTKQLEDWRENIESDADAQADLRQVIDEDYLYDDEYYDPTYDDRDVRVEVYHVYHYPYWFGYPRWYAYPRWRCYPHWYDWGFYFDSRGSFVIISLPSYHYVDWFFYHPHHHIHYSHLSAHFGWHYYHHRNHGGNVVGAVRGWRNRNREVINDDWFRDDGRLNRRFKEYGEFEVARQEHNRDFPDRQLTPKEFLNQKSRTKYPALNQSAKAVKAENRSKTTVAPKRPVRKQEPAVRPSVSKPEKPRTQPSTRPQKPNPKPSVTPQKPNSKPSKRPQKPAPKVDKARDYHKNKWEWKMPTPKPRTNKPKATPKPKQKTPQKPRTTIKKPNRKPNSRGTVKPQKRKN